MNKLYKGCECTVYSIVIMNALIVSLCYRGTANYVKNEGTLRDIGIIREVLREQFKFDDSDIKILEEENATVENFTASIKDMSSSGAKRNFIYFVGHGFTLKNTTTENDPEANDSGFVFYDKYLLDDDMCSLLELFRKDTKNLLMFAQCHSGDSGDLKFRLLTNGTSEVSKRKRAVKSKTVLISAVAHDQVSWCYPSGTTFAQNFRKVLQENISELTFSDLMARLRELEPRQKCSISSSFKLDNDDNLYRKKGYTWSKI